jgi:tripartite-type tricarboxylate transporter receptor subunit TctC
MPFCVNIVEDAPMRIKAATALILMCLSTSPSLAQWSPERPIRVVTPCVAGSSYDSIMRMLAEPMSQSLKQQVVVDNRAGASGIIGADIVAKAAPDGHTLAFLGDNHLIFPAIGKSTPYDLFTDFAPIMRVAKLDNVVVSHFSLPAQNLKELIALFKANPGKYKFGSGGPAGTTHLAGERFALMAGVSILHVPYKGGATAMTGMLGNEVNMMIANMVVIKPHVQSGRLRAYAVAAGKRSEHLPGVPSTAEAGLPGLEVPQFYAMFAPARTPARVLTRVESDLKHILASPAVRTRIESQGADVALSNPQELAVFLKEQLTGYRKTALAAGIKAE